MEYAVIQTGGKQYKVSPGMMLDVDSLKDAKGEVTFDKVLLHVNGDVVAVGTPHLTGLVVSGRVLGAKKGEKIRVSKFKGKSRYRKSIGFRESLTSVEILPFGKAKVVAEKQKAAKKEVKKV